MECGYSTHSNISAQNKDKKSKKKQIKTKETPLKKNEKQKFTTKQDFIFENLCFFVSNTSLNNENPTFNNTKI